jgi:hypothetical protein
VDVLIDADTIRSPELRHEIPVTIIDPILYGEAEGAAFAVVSPLDAPRIAEARPELQLLDVFADLGLRQLTEAGAQRHEALLEVRLRACRELGVRSAARRWASSSSRPGHRPPPATAPRDEAKPQAVARPLAETGGRSRPASR